MANRITLKKSSVAGKVPLATDLVAGELALNTTDMTLYAENTDGEVQLLAGGLSHANAAVDDGGFGTGVTFDGVVSYATRPGPTAEDGGSGTVSFNNAVVEFYRKKSATFADPNGFGYQNPPPIWRFKGDSYNVEIIEGKLYRTQVDGAGGYWIKEEIGAVPEFLSAWAYQRNVLTPNTTAPVHAWIAVGNEGNIDAALVPKGTGAILAQAPDNTATGGNKRGASAVDWQTNRTAATQVASGAASVISGGVSNTASGSVSTVSGGGNNTASGQFSSIPGGRNATTNGLTGVLAYGFASQVLGQNQMSFWQGVAETTSATPMVLSAIPASTPSTGRLVLRDNSAFRVRGTVVARNTSTNDCKEWTFEALIKRGASAAATAIVGTPSITSTFADAAAASWGIAVTADTTNGALAVTATGAASTTIRWTAVVHSIEVA